MELLIQKTNDTIVVVLKMQRKEGAAMAMFYTKGSVRNFEICDTAAAFPFLKESGHVVSLVGAGGKSSLLYELARYSAANGLNTLVTTTTHIFRPDDAVYADDMQKVNHLWDSGSYAVIGTPNLNGKLSMPPGAMLQCLMNKADIVLIEADGSKRMPVKVPEKNEPVILPECDIVIGVLGLSALHHPLKDVCFRLEKATDFLNVDAKMPFTEVQAAQILSSELGTRKNVGQRFYMTVLNQCDNQERMRQGACILELLSQKEIPGVMSCFKEGSV